jgi:hypothetical protein
MKLIIAIFITLLLTNGFVYGQKTLTKEEILRYWNVPSDKRIKDSASIVDSDSTLNICLSNIVDSLQANDVDSILVFSTAYPGYFSRSSCDTGIFPITTFVIWTKDGGTYLKKLKGACLSDVIRGSSLSLFEFYSGNYQKLKSGNFMPVILGGQINKDKTISYSMSWIDHEPNYSFYYRIGNDSRSFHFCESYIENRKSMFRDYNLTLAAYHWWKILKKETDKID